jgi:methylenetetrahydrofolate dehydrogenase (NADP+) / methenyltetrahydrofolate cyclohydrolase
MPDLIDGKKIAADHLAGTARDIADLRARGITPGLAVVLIGENPASLAYVRSKDKTCRELGMHSRKIELPASTPQEEVLSLIADLNTDPAIHGILVQSPPPPHIDERAVVLSIDPRKDVDGFHPANVAALAMDDPAALVPCTPLGCVELLRAAGIPTSGAQVAIVGRSLIVGKPLALLLLQKGADATVTVAHSRTRDLATVTRAADIVVAAIGRPCFLRAEHVRDGAIVIDVGINRIEDPASPRGYRLVGDVDFDTVAPRCRAITPVPGGVGPMTIAMLMHNTVRACRTLAGTK